MKKYGGSDGGWKIGVMLAAVLLISMSCCGDGAGSARSAGMGGTGAVLDGFWALLGNQAGLSSCRSFTVGVAAGSQFLLKETGKAAVVASMPVRGHVLGLSYRQSRANGYREGGIGVALARTFGDRISAGLQPEYRFTRLDGQYGRAAGMTFQAGIQVKMSEAWLLGIHLDNPLAVRYLKNEGERPEGHYAVGILYCPAPQVLLCIEICKEFQHKPLLRAGLEYQLDPLVIVRAGIESLPAPARSSGFSTASVYSFGYGLTLRDIHIDLGARIHNMAGFSPAISAFYVFR